MTSRTRLARPKPTPSATAPEPTEAIASINADVDRITFDVAKRAPGYVPRPARELAFERILVAVDGSKFSRLAVAWGTEIARVYQGQLEIVTVVGPLGVYEYYRSDETPPVVSSEEDLGRRTLDAALAQAKKAGVPARARLLYGSPAAEIVRAAREGHADLVVVGSHGRSVVRRLFLGSVADAVKNQPGPSLLVVRGPPPARRILVPTDGSTASREAASVAADLAAAWDAKPLLLHVVPPPSLGPPEPGRLAFKALYGDLDLEEVRLGRFRLDAQYGKPADRILATAQDERVGLVVMGSRGIGGFRGAVAGSVSARVVHGARATILLVKEPYEHDGA